MAHWSDVIAPAYVRNVANRYMVDNPLEAFDIFPAVPTTRLTGYLAKYDKSDWFKVGSVDAYRRSGATESAGDDFATDKQAYTIEEFAFHKDVTEDDRNEYDNPYDPINDAVDFVMNRLSRVLLTNLIDTYLATNIWANDIDLSASAYDQWDATTNGTSDADPVAYVLDWMELILKTTGYKPNKMIITWDVLKALKTNTKIMDKMKTTNDKVITTDLLARLFEVDKLTVLSAVNTTATDFMLTKKIFLGYTPPRPTKFAPSAGYHMTYRNFRRESVQTKKIIMEHLNNAVRIEGKIMTKPLVVATDLGCFVDNVVG